MAVDHEVSWHEHLFCAICRREFYGDCALRAHEPCRTAEWRQIDPQTWEVLGPRGALRQHYRHIPGDLWVLLEEDEAYQKMQARAAKAREGRGGKK